MIATSPFLMIIQSACNTGVHACKREQRQTCICGKMSISEKQGEGWLGVFAVFNVFVNLKLLKSERLKKSGWTVSALSMEAGHSESQSLFTNRKPEASLC